ncbi:tRNA1(Val) (adenine(37)-N6)-methyltransferase [Niabella hibiscisoli]|uniref:tRNA1(Val) (adenine(37)-N6)-methyltransferase n=1 Tax=Niabella hibiscisoli TaxID=1825928 RepID=UPI001F0F6FFC|nr:methyltransferase [Niabella hibiscisoli]MCH5718726.1 methyltransferase [Niabella hibiscisoli]
MKVTTDSCLFGAWVADHLTNLDDGKSVLDIGSGSGLLSLMIAQQTRASVESIEIQKTDYLQSLNNIANSPFASQVTIYHADALRFPYDKKYDVIISNPPFYENDLKGLVEGKNIAHHDEGLKLPELLQLIARQLTPGGNFYLLLPYKRLTELLQLITTSSLFINEMVTVHQTENHDAFRVLISGSFNATTTAENKIKIKEAGTYSQAFTRLLRDYYLYL